MSGAPAARARAGGRVPKPGAAASAATPRPGRRVGRRRPVPGRELPDQAGPPGPAPRLHSAWDLGRIYQAKWIEIAALEERKAVAPEGSLVSILAQAAYDVARDQAMALDSVILASPATCLADTCALAVHAWLRTDQFEGPLGSQTSVLVNRALAHIALSAAAAGGLDLTLLGDGPETLNLMKQSVGVPLQVPA